jgi:myo-inositol 2-dehydrogenase/D-chiro-inositol 1-dehydrogenase
MNTTRVGLIGAGGISHPHLSAWLALGAEVSVHSLAGAEELVAAQGGGDVVTDLDTLLERCDIVDIVTPTPEHHRLALIALQAGKDVVCEKPLARTLADAQDLVDVAGRLDRQLYPAHVVRFFPQYAALRRAVGDGLIGTPAVARFTRTGAFPSWSDWFADPTQSGGVVLDLMVHDLDIARWVLGEVTEVYGTATEDEDETGSPIAVAQATLTHAGGAISHVRGIWGRPGTVFRTSFHVAGDGGVLQFDSSEEDSLRVDLAATAAGGRMLPDIDLVESPYLTELREFLVAFQGGARPRVSGEDGVTAVALAMAVLESIRSGEPVRFAEEVRA